MVSVLASYSDDPSSYPAILQLLFSKLFERTKINEKEAGDGHF